MREPSDQRIRLSKARDIFLNYLKEYNLDILESLSKEPFEKYKQAGFPTVGFDGLGIPGRAAFSIKQLQLKKSIEDWARSYNLLTDWIIDRAYRTLIKWNQNPIDLNKYKWAPAENPSYFIAYVPIPDGFPEYFYSDGESRENYYKKIKSLTIEAFKNSPLLVPLSRDFPKSAIDTYFKKVVFPICKKYCDDLEHESKEYGEKILSWITDEHIQHTALRYAKNLSKAELAKEVCEQTDRLGQEELLIGSIRQYVLRTAKLLELPPFPRTKN